jgi:hypothetical protein
MVFMLSVLSLSGWFPWPVIVSAAAARGDNLNNQYVSRPSFANRF